MIYRRHLIFLCVALFTAHVTGHEQWARMTGHEAYGPSATPIYFGPSMEGHRIIPPNAHTGYPAEMKCVVPPHTVHSKVYMDIAIGGEPVGRLVFALYNEAPKTSENFRALCTRYCRFHWQ